MGPFLATAAWAAAAGSAAVTADTASGGGDAGALYASISAVVVAMIGGTVAIVTTRRNQSTEPTPVRYLDPPSSNALPAALAELYEHAKDELETTRIERDLWRRRALQAGWDE